MAAESIFRVHTQMPFTRNDPSPGAGRLHRIDRMLRPLFVLLFLSLLNLGIPRLTYAADATTADALLKNIRFQRLLTGEGEGEKNGVGAILDIEQDNTGYIWIAGESGLAKYDAHDFTFYYANPKDPRSLPSNWVTDLQLDHDGVLWVATANGLSRYNHETDDFTLFRSDAADNEAIGYNLANALVVDRHNNLIVGTGSGLSILDNQRRRFTNYRHSPADSHSVDANPIVALMLDRDGHLWLGHAGGGISKWDGATGKFQHWRHDPSNPASLVDNSVQTIGQDRHGNIWVGTDRLGLSRMLPDGKSFRNYSHQRDDPRSIGSNVIRDILLDSRNNLWIATDHGGLALYDERTDSFSHLRHHTYDRTTLISDQLRDIYEDRLGNLWIGAVPTGVNFYDISKSRFEILTHQPDNRNSLSHNGVLCIFQDSEGLIWIGTEAGLDAYNPASGDFVHYAPDSGNPDKLRFGAITSVTEDSDGSLWVASWSGGLHRFDKTTKKFKNYYPVQGQPSSLIGPHIWKVTRDVQNRIWIGATQQGGLSLYQPATDNFKHFRHDPGNPNSLVFDFVWSLQPDDRGNLWIGTLHGLDRFDIAQEKFTHFRYDAKDPSGISSNNVLAMIMDSRGMIWLGTEGGGISLLDPDTEKFRTFTVSDGMPSTHVASVVEDKNGHIWAGTSNGLVRIDRDTFTIKVLRKSDGLAGNTHHRFAALAASDGLLYIGSTEGISVFDPAALDENQLPPTIVITDFRLLNKDVPIGKPGSPLSKAIDRTRAINLNYSDAMFAFDFAALNFSSSGQTRYAYRLDGFDRSWNHVGTQRTATYTNLDPGDYVFRVKAETGAGVPSDGEATIAITIAPPPWRTWYAYGAYGLLILFALYLRKNYLALRVRSDQYKAMSTIDPLTKILNRAGLLQMIANHWGSDAEGDFCLLLFDVDHFKRVNDVRGHDAGDRILKRFTEIISANVRTQDYVARWGGEEFVLICRHASLEAGAAVAEKLRSAIAHYIFEQDSNPLHVTTSIGVAARQSGESFEELFKRADVALYKAKASGRNCVVTAEPPTSVSTEVRSPASI